MQSTSYLRIKTLIDLEPQSTKYRGSRHIEQLFKTAHKRNKSECSDRSAPKSTQHKIPLSIRNSLLNSATNSCRKKHSGCDKTKIVLQSATHSRKASQRDNKENSKENVNSKDLQIVKLKEQFEKALKKKIVPFGGHASTITIEEITDVMNQMGIMRSQNIFFKQFLDSIVQMLKIGCNQLLAINFFLVVLALLQIHLSKNQLKSIIRYTSSVTVIELDICQVSKIAQTYRQIMAKSTKQEYRKSSRQGECLQINVTLPDNKKQKIIFNNSQDCQQIAKRIMSKYAIPQQKLKSIEHIIRSKLNSTL